MLGASYNAFISTFESQYNAEIEKMIMDSKRLSISSTASEIFFKPLITLSKNGKRFRPYLVTIGSGSLDDQSIDVGIALELLHTFALIHDDIMDGAKKRRGVSTAHTTFSNITPEGESAAMLLGDFILAYANEYMSLHVPDMMGDFGEMQRFLCLGQFYELYNWNKKISQNTSQKISVAKSAQYTFMYPLRFGLMLAHQSPYQLDTYAYYAGLSFQIRDDWLDVDGSIESGKDTHTDGKNTVPNTVQLRLKKNNYNHARTKADIVDLLQTYRDRGLGELKSAKINPAQKESLAQLLQFSTQLS